MRVEDALGVEESHRNGRGRVRARRIVDDDRDGVDRRGERGDHLGGGDEFAGDGPAAVDAFAVPAHARTLRADDRATRERHAPSDRRE